MQNSNRICALCNLENKDLEQVIYQTKNFLVIHNIYPVAKAHLMIIPRRHLTCFAAIPEKNLDEFLRLKEKICKFLFSYKQSITCWEHGILGQSIEHAHLHLAPFEVSFAEKIFNLKRAKNIGSFSDLRDFYEEKGKYLYIEDDDGNFAEENLKEDIFPAYLTEKLAELLGVSQRIDERERKFSKWFFETKKDWERWVSLKI